MAFVNTRDTIGDQATVDGLVEHSLTELKEDGIAIIGDYACYTNQALQSVDFPNITRIGQYAFHNNTNLEVVKLGGESSTGSLTINAYAFNGCSKLQHLVIDRPTMATLAAASGLNGTQIALGEGAVYVPENLVATYKAYNNWKNYFITKLQKYPLSVFDSIEDSWSDIFANANYATDYTVKDTKTLELTDGTKIKMDLAAIDTDVKSDNTGTAKMTWICHGIPFTHRMNATKTTSGGWAESEMRSYLISDILSKIPTEIKSHIVSVKKSYRTKSPNDETLWSDDEIWIPSYREVIVNAAASDNSIESDGVKYSLLFNNTGASRMKRDASGTTGAWWFRSAFLDTMFMGIGIYNGDQSATDANATYPGVVFGFCTD